MMFTFDLIDHAGVTHAGDHTILMFQEGPIRVQIIVRKEAAEDLCRAIEGRPIIERPSGLVLPQ